MKLPGTTVTQSEGGFFAVPFQNIRNRNANFLQSHCKIVKI